MDAFEKRKKIIYEFICSEFYTPMKIKELAILLQVPKEQRSELKAVLDVLEAEGKISVSSKGKYSKGEAKRLVGVYQSHPRGFGFVVMENEEEDLLELWYDVAVKMAMIEYDTSEVDKKVKELFFYLFSLRLL